MCTNLHLDFRVGKYNAAAGASIELRSAQSVPLASKMVPIRSIFCEAFHRSKYKNVPFSWLRGTQTSSHIASSLRQSWLRDEDSV